MHPVSLEHTTSPYPPIIMEEGSANWAIAHWPRYKLRSHNKIVAIPCKQLMQAEKNKQNKIPRVNLHHIRKLSNVQGASNSLSIICQNSIWIFNNIYRVKNKIMDNIHKARLSSCQFIDRFIPSFWSSSRTNISSQSTIWKYLKLNLPKHQWLHHLKTSFSHHQMAICACR